MKRLALAFLLLASPVSAAVYTYPSNYFPAVGDTVTTSKGTRFQVTGSCTYNLPGTRQYPTAQLIPWGVVPCHDFINDTGATIHFSSKGTLNNTTCTYQEYFYCPGTPSLSQDLPLDMGKAISFLLGGLTGLGFVLASSSRW